MPPSNQSASSSRLSKGQWTQWGVATAVSTVVMAFTVLTWVEARVYTRVEGTHLEKEVQRIDKRHEKFEDKVDSKLTHIHTKLNKVYELMIEQRRGKE